MLRKGSQRQRLPAFRGQAYSGEPGTVARAAGVTVCARNFNLLLNLY
jgi:hypothetical protein